MSCDAKIKQKQKRYCIGDLKHTCKVLKSINRQTNNLKADSVQYMGDVLFTTKCRLETLKGVVYVEGIATLDESTHGIVMRYSDKIRNSYFIEIHGDYYEIKDISNVNEENRFLYLKCIKKGSKTIKGNNK